MLDLVPGRVCILDERQQPLVSVIIPAYQAAGRIRDTLDSMFPQELLFPARTITKTTNFDAGFPETMLNGPLR